MADEEENNVANDLTEGSADACDEPVENDVTSNADTIEQSNADENSNGNESEQQKLSENAAEEYGASPHAEQPTDQFTSEQVDKDSEHNETSRSNYSSIDELKDGEDEKSSSGAISDLERKIFVGGLSWETTAQDVKEYFAKYGSVLDCNLKTDPSTGRSRGFAFVLFDQASSVDKVFSEPIHMLHDRKIDPKKALARGGRDPIKKIFVGGLPPELPIEDIKEYFGKYGKIVEVEQPFDRVKNQRRAFIFITYESEKIVEQAVASPKQVVCGKEVDVRKATPKVEPEKNRGNANNQRGPPGPGPEGWPAMVPGYPPPPGYEYYGGYYGQPYGAYPPGYDYSGYYDYSAYYAQQQQQPPADWSSYTATAAAAPAAPAGYAQPAYTGYDYSSWYGTDQSGAASQAGKVKRGGGAAPYHPYSR